jgi:hypothetical protein
VAGHNRFSEQQWLGKTVGDDIIVEVLLEENARYKHTLVLQCSHCGARVKQNSGQVGVRLQRGSKRECAGCAQMKIDAVKAAPLWLTDDQCRAAMLGARQGGYKILGATAANYEDDIVGETMFKLLMQGDKVTDLDNVSRLTFGIAKTVALHVRGNAYRKESSEAIQDNAGDGERYLDIFKNLPATVQPTALREARAAIVDSLPQADRDLLAQSKMRTKADKAKFEMIAIGCREALAKFQANVIQEAQTV